MIESDVSCITLILKKKSIGKKLNVFVYKFGHYNFISMARKF